MIIFNSIVYVQSALYFDCNTVLILLFGIYIEYVTNENKVLRYTVSWKASIGYSWIEGWNRLIPLKSKPYPPTHTNPWEEGMKGRG